MRKQYCNTNNTMSKENQIKYLINIFNNKFMIRRKKSDKNLFLDFAKNYFSDYGYKMLQDSDKKNINIYSGNIQNAKFIFTAHYDTPCNSFIMNISNKLSPLFGVYSPLVIILLTPVMIMFIDVIMSVNSNLGLFLLLCFFISLFLKRINKNNMNDNTSGLISLFLLASTSYNNKDIAFILFDNEEKGLKGSKQFSKKSINLINKNAIIINLDCVGNGTTWCIYSNEDTIKSKLIENLNGVAIKKGILTSSDHKPFIKLRDNTLYISKKFKSKFAGYYHKNIHTNLDRNINESDIIELINILKKIVSENS